MLSAAGADIVDSHRAESGDIIWHSARFVPGCALHIPRNLPSYRLLNQTCFVVWGSGYLQNCPWNHAAFESWVLALSPTQSQGKFTNVSLHLSLIPSQVGFHAFVAALPWFGNCLRRTGRMIKWHRSAKQELMVANMDSAMRVGLAASDVSHAMRSALAIETRQI